MTCLFCRHDFCWICGHRWRTHSRGAYTCNRDVDFDEKFSSKAGDQERASFFSQHYRAHVGSRENELKAKERILQRLADLYIASGMPGDQASEFAIRVVSAIDSARSVLIWSYPCAFFMKPGRELKLFQHLQAELVVCIEELTDCVENKSDSPMAIVMKYLVTVEKNTEVLIMHCA
jgi:hypothetical protein